MITPLCVLVALAGLLDVESLLSIRHPGSPVWSPDGSHVAFVWDRAGAQNLFVVDAVGGWPEARTAYRAGNVGVPFWSADGGVVYFERDGELYAVPATGPGSPAAVFGTEALESGVRPSPDGRQVAFIRLGDVWIRSFENGREKRLTVTLVAESDLRWSPDGARIAFTFARGTPREESYDYIGRKLLFQRIEGEPQDVGVVSVEGGGVTPVAPGPHVEHFPRWLDAQRLTLERVNSDLRTREVVLADVTAGELRTLHRDEDAKWWSLGYLGAEPRPSPDGRFVAFVSDATGWDRLYVVATNGSEARPLTADGAEVRRFAWSPDGSSIAYDANDDREHPGRRQLFVVNVDGENAPRALTEGSGTNTQPSDASGFGLVSEHGGWSPDGTRLLFQHTDARRPADLFWVELDRDSPPRELTYSLPQSVERDELIEPELVFYTAPDGREVPAYLFVPRDLDRERRHPAIVWIHGDGIAQNYEGWHVRRDYAVYYSFHQYLAQKGYIVLAPDYRGSIGYGKAWRQLPYRDLGGGDYEDIAASVPYLESLLYVDPGRIGVWGLSYGGFLTLQALTRDPELFRCGIDVAGVHDFRYWYRDPGGRWIVSRLGSPSDNREAYVQAAPVERVDRIVRPLLVLHGTADENVPFLESLHLVDELMKNGKDFDFVVYPGELHYFHREHVLRDAWRRVETFFSSHLRG